MITFHFLSFSLAYTVCIFTHSNSFNSVQLYENVLFCFSLGKTFKNDGIKNELHASKIAKTNGFCACEIQQQNKINKHKSRKY